MMALIGLEDNLAELFRRAEDGVPLVDVSANVYGVCGNSALFGHYFVLPVDHG